MTSQTIRNPVSQIIHSQEKNDEEEPKKKSREDWRKAKELEEARKAGTAPAAVDEEGRDINPHIPQYISNAPWYYGAQGPTLKHQRPQKIEDRGELTKNAIKGVDTKSLITKFRKGACENCGAITHKRKDCLERPRKVLAKYAESIVVHDEFILQDKSVNYDEKRDRWSSYDPAQHREIIEEFEKVEEAKRQLKAEKLKNNPDVELSDDEGNEDKYVDEVDMPGTKVDSKQRITVRNLRIREDTAKYLRNLDPNSAYYDPKTRSMRDNPNPTVPPEEVEFAGENFVRFTGDTTKHATAQLFAWEAHGKGVDVHLLAEPTKLELLQKEYDKKKDQFKSSTKDHIVEKYGGEDYLKAPPKSLLLAQTEQYVEYSRSGKIIKGMEQAKARSIYEEDVYKNNHTSVWGSYWNCHRWGYKCCKSFLKNSYCIIMKEKETKETTADTYTNMNVDRGSEISTANLKAASKDSDNEDSDDLSSSSSSSSSSASSASSASSTSSSSASNSEEESSSSTSSSPSSPSSKSSQSSSSSASEDEDKKKHKQKISEKRRKQKKLKKTRSTKKGLKEMRSDLSETTSNYERRKRKKPYNSIYDIKAPTEEEIEDWQRKRLRADDPMLQFFNK